MLLQPYRTRSLLGLAAVLPAGEWFARHGLGFTYALLQSIYEAMIVLKVQELEQPKASLPPAG